MLEQFAIISIAFDVRDADLVTDDEMFSLEDISSFSHENLRHFFENFH
jgi:hypothetical protein